MCRCGCPLNYMTRKVADILETCCAGLPDEACGVENGQLSTAAHLPFACTEACANAYLKLYEECGPDLRAGLPPADDTPAWDALSPTQIAMPCCDRLNRAHLWSYSALSKHPSSTVALRMPAGPSPTLCMFRHCGIKS